MPRVVVHCCLLLGLLAMLTGGYFALAARRQSAPRIAEQTSPPPSFDSDWPNLFGPTRDGRTSDLGLNFTWPADGPKELWRICIGRGYSSPVAKENRVILSHRMGDVEQIECFDLSTGHSLWLHEYDTTYKCPFEYSDGPYSTPVIDGERVYAIGAQGQLHCLNLATGAVEWRRNLIEEFNVPKLDFPLAGSLLVEGDLLIHCTGGKPAAGIVALNKHNGQTAWTATTDGASHTTPIAATIHGRRYVFALTEQNLVALDPADGRVFWSTEFCARSRDMGKLNACSPVVVGDLVVASGYAVGTMCVKVLPDGTFQELWRDRRNLDAQFTNIVVHDGLIFGCHSLDRTLRCLNLQTGAVVWKHDLEIGRGASSVLCGDALLMLGEPGKVFALNLSVAGPQTLAATTSSVLASPCYTGPMVHRGRLIVRNEKELACFDLRP